MTLQERAHELYENVHPICMRNHSHAFTWERFIITIKNNEVVAWPLECLVCTERGCPFHPEARNSFPKKQIQQQAHYETQQNAGG